MKVIDNEWNIWYIKCLMHKDHMNTRTWNIWNVRCTSVNKLSFDAGFCNGFSFVNFTGFLAIFKVVTPTTTFCKHKKCIPNRNNRGSIIERFWIPVWIIILIPLIYPRQFKFRSKLSGWMPPEQISRDSCHHNTFSILGHSTTWNLWWMENNYSPWKFPSPHIGSLSGRNIVNKNIYIYIK